MRREAGFTLLELMVAMVLLALLGVALAQGTRFGMQAWNRLDRSLDREPVALVQSFLRREIEQAQPIPVGGAAATAQNSAGGTVAAPPIAFAGGESALRFVATLPERVASPGLNEVTIRIEPGSAGAALVMSWQGFADEGAGGTKSLIDGIESGTFLYYGSPDGKSPPDWQEEWSDARTLPRLVGLRLKFRDARITWPTLMVAPMSVPDSAVPAT